MGERFGDVALLHDDEAHAIREAPGLVGSRCVAFDGGSEQDAGLRDDLNIRGVFQLSDHLRYEPATKRSHARGEVQRFGQDALRGDRPSLLLQGGPSQTASPSDSSPAVVL